MYGTSLEGIEQLMIMVPNFQPKRSGIVINNYFNYEGGVKECNCNVDNVRNGGAVFEGVCFDGKLNIYEMEYKDLVKYCFGKIKNQSLKNRLKFLTDKFKGEIFLNPNHKEKFYHVIYEQDLDIYDISSRYIAVVFLLTADETLWNRLEHAVKPNGFDFNKSSLKQISTDGFAIYQMAKTIWTGKKVLRLVR